MYAVVHGMALQAGEGHGEEQRVDGCADGLVQRELDQRVLDRELGLRRLSGVGFLLLACVGGGRLVRRECLLEEGLPV